ncbi:MAG TPA: carboxypeptidase regulatory-like domain-containing protein [Vicinamibacterales bacterium]
MAALLVVLGASSALAAGSISGQITDAVTHSGIPNAKVQFYKLNSNNDPITATADGNGNYSQSLADGPYAVLTQAGQGYINQVWNSVSCSAVCDVDSLTQVVVSGAAVTGINFALVSGGGRIAGTITSSVNGNPIVGARVYFIDSGQNVPFSTAITDGSGHYISDAGSVTGDVYVVTQNLQGFQDEGWDNHKCTIDGCHGSPSDPVHVVSGATTNSIDFALDPGGTIAGTVRDINNAPLANVQVITVDTTGERVDEATTDASGDFITSGLPTGTYYLHTRNSQGLVDYLYDHSICPGSCDATQGTPVGVTVGSSHGGINFVLPPGQVISGTVTAAVGGAPISDVSINISNAAGAFIDGAGTDASGHFTSDPLPPGTYFATTSMNGYQIELYNNITCGSFCPPTIGTPIVITNHPVTNVNFSLIATGTGSITGTVTDVTNNSPLNAITVQLFGPNGNLVTSTSTNASGVYTLSSVSTGSYYVRTLGAFIQNGTALIGQLYNGVTCINCQVQTSGGTLVTVGNGVPTNGINFALAHGVPITGTVTAAALGSPLQNVSVQVFNAAGLNIGGFGTNASGVYTSAPLPAGTYYVRTNANGYVNQLWQGQSCPQAGCVVTSGTPVVVNATTVSGINFALALGGVISGKVTTDASLNSQALQSVSVQIFSSNGVNLGNVVTDVSGNYKTSGLPAGNYYLRTATPGPLFVPTLNQTLAFVDQLYNGTTCVPACLNPTVGTPVAVTAGGPSNPASVNFALSTGGMISGSVIDAATSVGVGPVGVQIFTAAGVLAKATATNTAGGYTVAGLPPGTYYARTTMPNGVFYLDGLYQGMPCSSGCSVTTGTPITLLTGKTSSSIDFALSSGAGGITGTITDARTGAPMPNVTVQIYTAGGLFTKSANTGLAGTYATSGLAPGTYYARTSQDIPSGHANQLYSGDRCGSTCTVTNGTPIVVNASTMTTGIDFALGGFVTKSDFDSDGKTDIAVWRPSTGTWYTINSSTNAVTSKAFGAGYAPYNDIPVPGDYDGDGKTDIAVWRPLAGTWYIINSSTNTVTSKAFGAGYAPYNDIPVPGDYDGDGKTDMAVWRPLTGTWYIINSSTNTVTSKAFGAGYAPYNDIPVPGDYDGDGKTDMAVWRPLTGTWYIINSSTNTVTSKAFGAGYAPYNDVPVPGDYDGDGKIDIAVWRPLTGTWFIFNSSTNAVTSKAFGAGYAPYNDIPVPSTGVR